jgi:hypothetical protein
VTGEARPKKLLVGNKTPTGGDLYARVDGQPRVFLISAFQEDSLNKTPFGLRDEDGAQVRARRRRQHRD